MRSAAATKWANRIMTEKKATAKQLMNARRMAAAEQAAGPASPARPAKLKPAPATKRVTKETAPEQEQHKTTDDNILFENEYFTITTDENDPTSQLFTAKPGYTFSREKLLEAFLAVTGCKNLKEANEAGHHFEVKKQPNGKGRIMPRIKNPEMDQKFFDLVLENPENYCVPIAKRPTAMTTPDTSKATPEPAVATAETPQPVQSPASL